MLNELSARLHKQTRFSPDLHDSGEVLSFQVFILTISGWAIVTTCRPLLSVRPRLWTTSPLKPLDRFFCKLHVEPSVRGEFKIYTNGHSGLIKMAAMLIYGKITSKSSSPGPRKLQCWILVYSIKDSRSTVCSNDDPRLTFDYFTARSNLLPHAFVWGKGLKSYFLKMYVLKTHSWNNGWLR